MIRFHTGGTIASLKQIEEDIRVAARQALGQASLLALGLARSTATFKDRTGNLRGSIARIDKSPWAIFVQAGGRGVRYAAPVEYGSKAHKITAKNGGVLAFKVGGSMRFAHSVNHPGTKPTRFMQTARDQAEGSLIRFVEVGVNRAVQGR
jgi:hypothetical protein